MKEEPTAICCRPLLYYTGLYLSVSGTVIPKELNTPPVPVLVYCITNTNVIITRIYHGLKMTTGVFPICDCARCDIPVT